MTHEVGQKKKISKKRRFLATITMLAALPSFIYFVYFVFCFGFPIWHWLVWEKIGIVSICLIGGILLWQGYIWGYRLSLLGWALITFINISYMIASYNNLNKSIFPLYDVNILLNIVFILLGILIMFTILRDIRNNRGRGEIRDSAHF